ncbi:SpoIIE family protein phosphatase [Streptomyces sp. NPDC060205]|uniref:ATP-binding SpoIIE family protein phosphatase n=1 Tax=Streptomyces sp. NPDC060205 TaxID=3347072 RepID=UPI00364E5C0C
MGWNLSRSAVQLEALQARRDKIMAATLRWLQTRLQVSTSTIYLLTRDGRNLAAAVSIDSPLGFTVFAGMSVDDVWHSSARAYRTDELVVLGDADIQKLLRAEPAMVLHAPFPMTAVSVPLRTSDHRFGAVTLRWIPPRSISAEELRHVTAAADDLARALEVLGEQGASTEAPRVPVFVPAYDAGSEPVAVQADELTWNEHTSGSATAGSTFLYQLLELASELTGAARLRDVVAAAWAQVAYPFGGRAMMLCLTENEKLRTVGSAGFSEEAVRGVNGLSLSWSTPETDTVTKVEPMFFETAQELQAAYPGLERDEAGETWAFLPLITNGRAVGCCSLCFDRPRRLSFGERALLMIMMGQVGQSLERARAYEVEHTLSKGLQQALLPRHLPHLAEVEITARYLPATTGADVGGDWYDVVVLPGRAVGFVIGDVEGHSLEAAGTMGQIRTAVRSYAAEGHDPATVLSRSNHLMIELDTDRFATCCCLWLDLARGTALLASAGHHPPAITGPGGLIALPKLSVGLPLGIEPGTLYAQTEIELPPGGICALYTDGLLDVRQAGPDRAAERLRRQLSEVRECNLEVVADRIIGDSGPEAFREDDAALLLLRYEGVRQAAHRRVARISVQRHDLQGVGHMRHLLRDLLREWELSTLLDELELLASEVVTNALIHAHSEVDVRLREYPDRLRVEVRDSDPHPPVPVTFVGTDQPGNEEAESGRGLLIVDAVASAWGSSPAGRGKTTWFELGISAE